MARRLIYPIVAALSLLITAIGGCTAKPPAEDNVIRVVSITVPGTPWYDSWTDFGQRINATPTPDLTAKLYILGQLGSEENALSQLRRDRVQMGGFSLQGASSVVPELALLLAPYLFDSLAEVDYVMDHQLGALFRRKFADKGLLMLSWAEVGWTIIYGKNPYNTPEQIHGLKLRSSNALASQYLIEAVGADMVPLSFPDIIPSLQTGLIDGAESGIILYALSGVAFEAPNVTLTRHAFDTGVILANKRWMDRLSVEQRQSVIAGITPVQSMRRTVRAHSQAILDKPEDHGITFYQPTADELSQWRSATAKNHRLLIDAIGGDAEAVYDLIQQGKAEFAELQAKPALAQRSDVH